MVSKFGINAVKELFTDSADLSLSRVEQRCKRMRWKAFFYFNPNADGSRKERFGFSSRKSPPQVAAMLNFEKRLLNMIETIKFRKVKCAFQQKLSQTFATTS